MTLEISHNNVAGSLNAMRIYHADEDKAAMMALDAAKELLAESGGLYPGDSITVKEVGI